MQKLQSSLTAKYISLSSKDYNKKDPALCESGLSLSAKILIVCGAFVLIKTYDVITKVLDSGVGKESVIYVVGNVTFGNAVGVIVYETCAVFGSHKINVFKII